MIDQIPFETTLSLISAPGVDHEQLSNCSSTFYEYQADTRVGVWYEFMGNDRCMKITAEGYENQAFGVFTGTCDGLVCAEGDQYGSSSYFFAEMDVLYTIFVGANEFKGDFTFVLEEVSYRSSRCAVANQDTALTCLSVFLNKDEFCDVSERFCEEATEIPSLPATVSGDTSTSPGGSGYGCSIDGPDTKTEYFKFTGTGS